MTDIRWRDKVSVAPNEVKPNDGFAIKVVAVVGYANDWAAYYGPSDWSKERVASEGDKFTSDQAEDLFYVMSSRCYRD